MQKLNQIKPINTNPNHQIPTYDHIITYDG